MKYDIKLNEKGRYDIIKTTGVPFVNRKSEKISGGFVSEIAATNMLNKIIKGSK